MKKLIIFIIIILLSSCISPKYGLHTTEYQRNKLQQYTNDEITIKKLK